MKALPLPCCLVVRLLSPAVRSAPQSAVPLRLSEAETAFGRLKTLAGRWKGQAAMGPGLSQPIRVSFRVTSGGAALMHEMVPEGRSDDPARGDDDPVTMLY